MKKILFALVLCVMLVSCASTSIEYYSTPVLASNKLYIQLDQSTNTVSTGGVLYTDRYYGVTYVPPTSETAKLSTIRNIERIKEVLQSKGYVVVSSIDEADIIMVGESKSTSGSSVVSLGFYEKKTNQLMFICEGEYGYGFGVQDDLDNAILKALESVPQIR